MSVTQARIVPREMRLAPIALILALTGACHHRYEYREPTCPPEPPPRESLRVASSELPSTVEGVAVDADGRGPVARVTVHLGSRSATADTSGRFRFDSVVAGDHQLELKRIGYASRMVDSIHVSAAHGARLSVPLKAIAVDGCRGFMLERVERPWWKWRR